MRRAPSLRHASSLRTGSVVPVVGLVLAALALGGCPFVRSTPSPIPTTWLERGDADDVAERCAVVLLPGMWDRPDDFVERGFGRDARAAGIDLRLVAPDAHFGYYRKRTILDRLRTDVVSLLGSEHERVWIAGISLGGVGSLLYAREHGDDIDGIYLLAPFLGDDDLIDEIRDAGGVAAWSPRRVADDDFARKNWLWLKRWADRPADDRPEIWLGYGADDDFAGAGELLATILPEGRVFVRPGGHDWDAWSLLWRDFLASPALGACR